MESENNNKINQKTLFGKELKYVEYHSVMHVLKICFAGFTTRKNMILYIIITMLNLSNLNGSDI